VGTRCIADTAPGGGNTDDSRKSGSGSGSGPEASSREVGQEASPSERGSINDMLGRTMGCGMREVRWD